MLKRITIQILLAVLVTLFILATQVVAPTTSPTLWICHPITGLASDTAETAVEFDAVAEGHRPGLGGGG